MASVMVNNLFETVYYNFPVPNNRHTITLLSLLFDKVLLPGVYLPRDVSISNIDQRLKFLEDVKKGHPQHEHMAEKEEVTILLFLKEYKDLLDIFQPTGKQGYMGLLETETSEVTVELEELIYGPPPPNFFPTPNMGFNAPVGSTQINSPSWLSYPANAFVFSQKRGIPLLSDSDFLPVPRRKLNVSTKDAKTLSTYLMASAFSLILPRIRVLNSNEILETREKFNDEIGQFRASMMTCVSELEVAIKSNPTQVEIEKQSKYLAETKVLPAIEDLRQSFESPGSIAKQKIIDLALQTPELILNFQKSEYLPWAIIKSLDAVSIKVREGLEQYRLQNKKERESGLSLLLKLPRKFKNISRSN